MLKSSLDWVQGSSTKFNVLFQMEFKTVLGWLEEEAKTNRIHEVTDILLDKLPEKMEFLAVVFYDMEDDPTVEDLQVGHVAV